MKSFRFLFLNGVKMDVITTDAVGTAMWTSYGTGDKIVYEGAEIGSPRPGYAPTGKVGVDWGDVSFLLERGWEEEEE